MSDHTFKIVTMVEKNLSELREEIVRLNLKKRCPFWPVFALGTHICDCVYISGNNTCEDLETCPGNNDAWCYKQIDVGTTLTGLNGKPDISENVIIFETMLTKYADLRCNRCNNCYHVKE